MVSSHDWLGTWLPLTETAGSKTRSPAPAFVSAPGPVKAFVVRKVWPRSFEMTSPPSMTLNETVSASRMRRATSLEPLCQTALSKLKATPFVE